MGTNRESVKINLGDRRSQTVNPQNPESQDLEQRALDQCRGLQAHTQETLGKLLRQKPRTSLLPNLHRRGENRIEFPPPGPPPPTRPSTYTLLSAADDLFEPNKFKDAINCPNYNKAEATREQHLGASPPSRREESDTMSLGLQTKDQKRQSPTGTKPD